MKYEFLFENCEVDDSFAVCIKGAHLMTSYLTFWLQFSVFFIRKDYGPRRPISNVVIFPFKPQITLVHMSYERVKIGSSTLNLIFMS